MTPAPFACSEDTFPPVELVELYAPRQIQLILFPVKAGKQNGRHTSLSMSAYIPALCVSAVKVRLCMLRQVWLKRNACVRGNPG